MSVGASQKTDSRAAATRALSSMARQAATYKRRDFQRAPRVAISQNNAIKRMVANAKKTGFVDVALATYDHNTTGSIVLLNTVAQGASTSQRIGKKIMLKSLQCHALGQAGTAAVVNDCTVLIVYDKRPVGVLPAITDILNTANSNSFNNDANSGRFRILKRWDYTLIGNITAPATGQEAIEGDFFLKLHDLPTNYKAAGTGAIGDQEEGSLLLVTVGSNAAGTTAASFNAGFRLRFVDC